MTNSVCKTNLSPVEVGDELLSLATYCVYYIQLAFSVGFEFQVSNMTYWVSGHITSSDQVVHQLCSTASSQVRGKYIYDFIKFSLNFFINYTIFFLLFLLQQIQKKSFMFCQRSVLTVND